MLYGFDDREFHCIQMHQLKVLRSTCLNATAFCLCYFKIAFSQGQLASVISQWKITFQCHSTISVSKCLHVYEVNINFMIILGKRYFSIIQQYNRDVETQKISSSQSNHEKEKWRWGNQAPLTSDYTAK